MTPMLRICHPNDCPVLYSLIGEAEGNLWNLRDFIPGPQQFVEALFQNALGVYVGGETPAVEFAARVHDVDYASRRADLGVLLIPGVDIEVSRAYAHAFLQYLFHSSPLAKLVVQAAPEDYSAIRTVLGDSLADEGALLDHTYTGGRFVDVKVGAVFRQSFVGDTP